MGVIDALKSIASKVAKGTTYVAQYLPIARLFVDATGNTVDNRIVDSFTAIHSTIQTMELVRLQTGLSGADAAKAALPVVKQAILASEVMVGKEVINEDLFNECCQEYIDTSVKLYRSIKVQD